MIVAIDGPVGSGKSTVGGRLADRLGLPFVDSGHFYRALAVLALEQGLQPGDDEQLVELARSVRIDVGNGTVRVGDRELTSDIYRPELNRILSPLAQVRGVREAMVAQQRELGRGGVVMAGRDIGTVVFPTADFKFFLTASVEERVRRRSLQYERRGEKPDREAMAREVAERDRLDSEREVAPLRAAPDAVLVDTDRLTLDEVVEALFDRIENRG